MRKILIAAFAASLLAACASQETQDQAPVEERTPGTETAAGTTGTTTAGTAPGAGPSGTATAPGAGAPGGAVVPPKDPANILSKRSIYFDYDMFVVKDEYRSVIEAHAKFLRENRNARMILQGHADERGSPEYNLALGQKRAESVRRALALLGAADAQIEAVSFGEEKPRNPGHHEGAWAENRRCDIAYQGE